MIEMGRKVFLAKGGQALLGIVLALNAPILKGGPGTALAAGSPLPPDFDLPRAGNLPEGHLYRQTSGDLDLANKGYLVANTPGAPMLEAFNRIGGVENWGYPLSQSWIGEDGKTRQTFQKGVVIVESDAKGGVTSIDYEDVLDKLDKTTKFKTDDLIPAIRDWTSEVKAKGNNRGHTTTGPLEGTLDEAFITTMFTDPAYSSFEQFYFSNRAWFEQYGLPVGGKDYGSLVVLRCQKTALQLWRQPQANITTEPNQIVVANTGELAKKYGFIPKEALELFEIPKELTPLTAPLPAVGSRLKPGEIVWEGKSGVCVTIDDLNDPVRVRRMLQKAFDRKKKVTLFGSGVNLEKNADNIRFALSFNCELELHGQAHLASSTLSYGGIIDNFKRNIDSMRKIVPDYQPLALRPPYGDGIYNYYPPLIQAAKDLGLAVIMWRVDSRGWAAGSFTAGTFAVRNNTIPNMHQGAIVLLHDDPADEAILGDIFDRADQLGLECKTISQAKS